MQSILRYGCLALPVLMLAGCALPHRIPESGATAPPAPAQPQPAAIRPAPAPPPSISAQPLPQLQPLRTTRIRSPAAAGTAAPSPPQTPASQGPSLPSIPAHAGPVQAGPAAVHQVDGIPLPKLPQLGSQPGATAGTAGAAPSGSDLQRARAALADLNDRANLDDAQTKRMQDAQAALTAGNAARAASLAVPLDARVRRARSSHTVTAGENLWVIAARSDIYGNGYLWPLIWDANRAQLPDPASLRSGIKLTIPLYPTLEQTAAALDYSHHHPLAGAPSDH